ncbi:hypothetical protein J6590_028660 [Homalodisca vitripennis]|nr:hypothetical protein J6590_028660 [Homalodisca vitripennis]
MLIILRSSFTSQGHVIFVRRRWVVLKAIATQIQLTEEVSRERAKLSSAESKEQSQLYVFCAKSSTSYPFIHTCVLAHQHYSFPIHVTHSYGLF